MQEECIWGQKLKSSTENTSLFTRDAVKHQKEIWALGWFFFLKPAKGGETLCSLKFAGSYAQTEHKW